MMYVAVIERLIYKMRPLSNLLSYTILIATNYYRLYGE